jgi:hypothetical protein
MQLKIESSETKLRTYWQWMGGNRCNDWHGTDRGSSGGAEGGRRRQCNDIFLLSLFQTFAVFSMFYSPFWLISRRLNFVSRRFGVLCQFHLRKWCLRRWNWQSITKRRQIIFRRQGITHIKEYNICLLSCLIMFSQLHRLYCVGYVLVYYSEIWFIKYCPSFVKRLTATLS